MIKNLFIILITFILLGCSSFMAGLSESLITTSDFFDKSSSLSDSKKYKVTVRRIGNNLYKDLNSGAIIKTSLCLELAIADDAILILDCPFNVENIDCGKLIFLDSGESCQVDVVYY